MTTVSVLAGARTIGGTQIVVEDQGARLLFDCGLVYDPEGDPFAEVRRRPGRVLSDLLTLGLAPQVSGLYDPRWLAGLPPTMFSERSVHDGPLAVALSHSHLDHTYLAGFIDPAVPVHCSSPTARIVETLGTLGNSVAPSGRSFTSHAAGDWFSVGSIRAQFLAVDHDVAGARGLLIETSDGVIAYSGDLRLHGSHPELSHSFAHAAKAAGARLLILEGTRLFPPAPAQSDHEVVPTDRLREADVSFLAAEALAGAPGMLGIILLTPENGERVESLAQVAHGLGRLLVLDPEGVALTIAALGRPLAAPYAVYVPTTLAAGLDGDIDDRTTALLRAATAGAPAQLSAADIAADPGRFLVRLNWPDFADLLDMSPAGGVVLHANGLPLGPFDPAWRQLEWWVRRLELRLVQVGSSGHAMPADLTAIAVETGAPVVMAIHSLHPELLDTGGARLLLPEAGKPYELAELRGS